MYHTGRIELCVHTLNNYVQQPAKTHVQTAGILVQTAGILSSANVQELYTYPREKI